MQWPALDDTIIAVSSGWQAAAAGIVRLSGPASFELADRAGARPPLFKSSLQPVWTDARLRLDDDLTLPADAFWFHEPKSYTGQNVVELHTVGCLPLLRTLCARLVGWGARRALPGEFTARAFLGAKLDARQVEGVLSLINAASESAARLAARLQRGAHRGLVDDLREQITELLARIEAGIDFVEEEDVCFITASEAGAAIERMGARIDAFGDRATQDSRAAKPHVALVGLPNAGKSTLFNALLGYERAIVSPVLGTTRDVLSAEIEINGIPVVLQDCAGLGASADELELAAHLAAERAADRADLLLWVHDCSLAWRDAEIEACRRLPPDHRLLVLNKTDTAPDAPPTKPLLAFARTLAVSAVTGAGLEALGMSVTELLARVGVSEAPAVGEKLAHIRTAFERARGVLRGAYPDAAWPELVALELRDAYSGLDALTGGALVEEVLGRIFSQFCVGK